MAAAGPREGGRESAPATPSRSTTEEQARTAENDFKQLIGHPKERPDEPQAWSFTLKLEDPQRPHVKEEERELKITHEGECPLGLEEDELTKLPLTGVSVKTEDLEDKPLESSCWLGPSDPQQLIGHQKECLPQPPGEGSTLKQEDPQPPQVKEEANTREPLSSDPDCEGDIRTHTDNKHYECSKKKMGKICLTCSVCAKSFSRRGDFTRHMRTHTGEKPFSCSVCAKNFSLQCNLTQHMLMHTGEKRFACSLCGKNYRYRQSLTDHMLKHAGVKPFGCSVCRQRFLRKSNMSSHIATHTRAKRFSCTVCDKMYSNKSSLTYHMATHTEEKRFRCSVCGQRFSHKSILVSHMRRHTGEKPFSCSVCGKRFPTKTRLVSHMTTHKLFSCSICGKKYSYKYLSKFHMRKHLREKARQERVGSASDIQPKHYWNQKGFEWSF